MRCPRSFRLLLAALVLQLSTVDPVWAQGELSFTRQDFGVDQIEPFSVAVGDFNGDGQQDLATANTIANTVSILLGNGDGTFEPPQDFGAGAGPASVIVGDFNGDTQQDLATANFNGSSVSILLGQGDGTFSPAQPIGVGQEPQDLQEPISVTVGDFNGDSQQDLATANIGGSASILMGRGDGTFEPAQDFGAGGDPRSITVGDFNGDSQQDLATANTRALTVSILLGNGDGTFEPAQDFGAGGDPRSITVGDFNGDGQQDLATVNFIGSNVSILLGCADGTFEPVQHFGVGRGGPVSITVGDFNGDSQQDLAIANTGGSVSILINNTAVEIAVKIDIKPGSFPNSINPRSKGVIPVAVLTTATFDASTVDPTTVFFGANGNEAAPLRSALEDVDGDGNTDMVLHFRTQDTGIVCGNTSASLTGKIFSGQAIEGSDSIRTVGCR